MSSPPVTVRKREPSRLLAAHRLRGGRDQTGDPAAAGTVLDPPRGIGQLGETPVVPATCPIPRSEPRAPDNSDEFLHWRGRPAPREAKCLGKAHQIPRQDAQIPR